MEIRKGGKEYFNKKYIKDHPYYLFIYEDTLEDEDFEEYSNVFPIPTFDNEGSYFTDKYLDKNKDLIRYSISDIFKYLQTGTYKKIVMPDTSIGKGKSKLYKEEPKTYEYIKKKLKELFDSLEDNRSINNRSRNTRKYNTRGYNTRGYNTRGYNTRSKNTRGYNTRGYNIRGYNTRGYNTRGYNTRSKNTRGYNTRGYNTRSLFNTRGKNTRGLFNTRGKYSFNSNGSNNNRRYKRRQTKKEFRDKNKKETTKKKKKVSINSVKKASNYAQKRCNKCIKFKSLLKKSLVSESKNGDKFILELKTAEEKCIQCLEICKYLDTNMKTTMVDYDIYEARYPSICLIDDHGNKRGLRLMNSYRKKLLEQIEHIDLNLDT